MPEDDRLCECRRNLERTPRTSPSSKLKCSRISAAPHSTIPSCRLKKSRRSSASISHKRRTERRGKPNAARRSIWKDKNEFVGQNRVTIRKRLQRHGCVQTHLSLSNGRSIQNNSLECATTYPCHDFAEMRKVGESLPALQPIVTYLEWLGTINGTENVKINYRVICLVHSSH
jgi:hypothetical protein